MTSGTKSSFDLVRLMQVVFHPKSGERVAVFIDLENLQDIVGLKR